jgi:hypothetical protein
MSTDTPKDKGQGVPLIDPASTSEELCHTIDHAIHFLGGIGRFQKTFLFCFATFFSLGVQFF